MQYIVMLTETNKKLNSKFLLTGLFNTGFYRLVKWFFWFISIDIWKLSFSPSKLVQTFILILIPPSAPRLV